MCKLPLFAYLFLALTITAHGMQPPAGPAINQTVFRNAMTTLGRLADTEEQREFTRKSYVQKVDAQLAYIAALLAPEKSAETILQMRQAFEKVCADTVQKSNQSLERIIETQMDIEPATKDCLKSILLQYVSIVERYKAAAAALATWPTAKLEEQKKALAEQHALLLGAAPSNECYTKIETMLMMPGIQVPTIKMPTIEITPATRAIALFAQEFAQRQNKALYFDIDNELAFNNTEQESVYGKHLTETENLLAVIARTQADFVGAIIANQDTTATAAAYSKAVVAFFGHRKNILLSTAKESATLSKATQTALAAFVEQYVDSGEELAANLVAAYISLKANTDLLRAVQSAGFAINFYDLKNPVLSAKLFEALFESPLRTVAELVKRQTA